MAIIISNDTLSRIQLNDEELLVELACYLYEKKRLSMGKARLLAGLDLLSFQKELATRKIDIHYTEEDLNKDLSNLGIKL
jgi:predicted HTH domain antitoxin